MNGCWRSALPGQWKLCEPSFFQGYLSSRELCVIFNLSTDCSWMQQLAYILPALESNLKHYLTTKKGNYMQTNIHTYISFSYLCAQVIVKKFQCRQLFIHPFGIICLLFLYNLPSCLYDSFNFQFHLTEGLIEFLEAQICILVINL